MTDVTDGADTRKRRSLHVSDSAQGGGAEVVFQATVAIAAELGDETATYIGTESRNPLSYIFSLKHYRAFKRTLVDFSPDVVHLHNYYHYLSPSVLLALRRYRRKAPGCHVVFTAHDYHLVCPNSGFQHLAAGAMRNYDPLDPAFSVFDRFDERSLPHSVLKLAQHLLAYRVLRLRDVFDAIVAPSLLLKNVFERAGVRTPIRVVRNPIEFPIVHGDPQPGAGLVYLGRVAPEKGLVEFVRTLDEAGYGTDLDVYGSGPDVDRLTRINDELTHVRIKLMGRVDHAAVTSTLGRYRAFVHSSTWLENAPVSIIEAAATGLELVVCSGGGGEEMAHFAERRHVFTLHAPESVVSAVETALAQTEPNRVIDPDEFSSDTYARKIDEIYAAGGA